MNRLQSLSLAAIAASGLALPAGSAAAEQPGHNEQRAHPDSPELIADENAPLHYTVLTMTPDGAWGAATEISINKAIAGAIGNCRAMSGAGIGCGGYFRTIRAGWSLGLRCGREIIIAAQKNIAEAERSAEMREAALRADYVRDMPPCVRVVTVDPRGAIVVANVGSVQFPLSR